MYGVVMMNLQLSVARYRMEYRRTEEFPLGGTYSHHLVHGFTLAARRKWTPLLQSGSGTGTPGWGAPGSAQGLPTLRGGGGRTLLLSLSPRATVCGTTQPAPWEKREGLAWRKTASSFRATCRNCGRNYLAYFMYSIRLPVSKGPSGPQ